MSIPVKCLSIIWQLTCRNYNSCDGELYEGYGNCSDERISNFLTDAFDEGWRFDGEQPVCPWCSGEEAKD